MSEAARPTTLSPQNVHNVFTVKLADGGRSLGARKKYQLSVGSMGLTLLDGAKPFKSYIYANLASWEAGPSGCTIYVGAEKKRVVYGKPAGPALRAEAERLGAKRVFVTTTKSVAQSAFLADVIRDLGDRYAGVYSGITAHSPRPCVIEGAKLAREAGADLIVAVGGGSAIDATKVMLIALWQGAMTIDALDLYRAGRPKEGHAPPSEAIRPPADAVRMIAVPTTLSAAEFNPFAGISDPRHGIKESFGHRLVVPRVIVLDPAATLATPMDLMLSTGIKAVDHAVERLCSQQAHPFVLGTATEALRLLTKALPAHATKPDDMPTRLDLQFGMWLSIGAGTSGVGTGASHGIGHVLGAACHVPHGHTSCVMLPRCCAGTCRPTPSGRAG